MNIAQFTWGLLTSILFASFNFCILECSLILVDDSSHVMELCLPWSAGISCVSLHGLLMVASYFGAMNRAMRDVQHHGVQYQNGASHQSEPAASFTEDQLKGVGVGT